MTCTVIWFQVFLHNTYTLKIRVDTAIWMHYLDANKTAGEKARWQLHKNAASNNEQVLEPTPHKSLTIQPPTSHHENYQI